MNLTVYNPDEHEEPQEGSPIPQVQEEVENIVSFSVKSQESQNITVEEVAEILSVTEEKVIELIHGSKISALWTDIDEDGNILSYQIPRTTFYRGLIELQSYLFMEESPDMETWGMEEAEYMSVTEVMETLWINKERFLDLIRAGHIDAYQIKGDWKVRRAFFNEFRPQIEAFLEDDWQGILRFTPEE
jgi:hypothetical protein